MLRVGLSLPLIFLLRVINLPEFLLLLLLLLLLRHSCAATLRPLSGYAARGDNLAAIWQKIDSVVVATWPVVVVAARPFVSCLPGLIFVVMASWPVDVATWPAIVFVFVFL